MATITKRGRGYRVQVRMHGRKPQSKSFRTHALAVRWAREVEHALERAEMPSEADLGALCLKYRVVLCQLVTLSGASWHPADPSATCSCR